MRPMNVQHIPSINENLVSHSLFCRDGFKLVFKSNKIIICKYEQFIRKVYECGGELNKLHTRDDYNDHDHVHNASGTCITIQHVSHSISHTPHSSLELRFFLHVPSYFESLVSAHKLLETIISLLSFTCFYFSPHKENHV